MRFTRFYTKEDQDFCADALFCEVAHHENPQTCIVPQNWNQTALGVLQEDVFYPEVLPAALRLVDEPGVPVWLQRSVPDNATGDGISAEWRHHMEKDIREVLHRMAGSLTYQGWKDGMFSSENDAKVFYDELRYVLMHQIAAPELEQWRALGLDWAYGITPATPYMPQRRALSYKEGTDQPLRRMTILGETLALEGCKRNKLNIILPVENADSADFINWKKHRDARQAAEALGQRVMEAVARRVMDACDRDDDEGFNPQSNAALGAAMQDARAAGLPEAAIQMAVSAARQGYEDISFALPPVKDTAEEHVETTLCVSDEFVEAALTGHSFDHKQAQKLWDMLAEAVWSAGEPAITFRDSIETDAATDAPAPVATVNLLSCAAAARDNIVDTAALRHVTRLLVTALEILPAAAPEFRPLQLGMTNMAALLMSKGLAYDSDAARMTAALITAFLSGAASHASAEIASEKGACPACANDGAQNMLQGIKDKMALLSGTTVPQKGMMRRARPLRPALCSDTKLYDATRQVWEEAYHLGRETGFRHARLTGLDSDWPVQALLGAESQGLMPVATQLHGKSLTPLVPAALKALGYNAAQSNDIYFHAAGHGTLLDAPFINHKSLREKGFYQAPLDAVEAALATALHIRYAFNRWTLGDDFCEHMLGFSRDEMDDKTFDMLSALGFSEEHIEAANAYCCGTLGLAGAPHLKSEHMSVFNCDISPQAQIKMQTAAEPFLSGISAHTIRLDYAATVDDVQKLILAGWEQGIKKLRLYRDNGSLLHDLAVPAEQSRKTAESQHVEVGTGRKSA